MKPFSPPWWLRNPHAQTVWGRLTRARRLVDYRREVLETPDGDELLLDHLDAPITADEPRHFVLLHGLEGSSHSVYIQGVMGAIARAGHAATALNFRSCARHPKNILRTLPNRRPRFYHSGETTDFDFAIRTLAARMPDTTFVGFGASLGGNVLLKWLGEHPGQNLITAAATLSVPYDLGAGAQFMDSRASGRFYIARFLPTLRRKARDVVKRYPELATKLDLAAADRAKTFREFDDAITGPLHGFTGADDYYRRASSIHFLGRIDVPTLCVSAEDDPFLPAEVLPRAREAASASVEFLVTQSGGHVGFVGGSTPWSCQYWAEELVIRWLLERSARGERSWNLAAAQ